MAGTVAKAAAWPSASAYPPQNAVTAFCRAGTLGNPRAAAAALRPPNRRASPATL
jgi:hypothetical protein